MNIASPPKRLPRTIRPVAAASAIAVGAVLLFAPGNASAQTEIDCSAIGDNPIAADADAALDTAVACGVEVRIQNLSSAYATTSLTPQGQMHLRATVDPVQEHRDAGTLSPNLEEREGSLVSANAYWDFRLRYSDASHSLFETLRAGLDWSGETPLPTYAGTTASYEDLAPGLDLTFDVGAATTGLEFVADDTAAWDALASDLTVPSATTRVWQGALYTPNNLYPGEPYELTTPFTVRDSSGATSSVDLSISTDRALTIAPPEGFLDTAAFPLTLSTQWAYREFRINEWSSVTSAAPDLPIYRGESGLDQPYFETSGESGDAVVGSYCDTLVDPGCTTASEAATYWGFSWPQLLSEMPRNAYRFRFPVTSATFQVDAAEGTACTAPDLQLVDPFLMPAAGWSDKPTVRTIAGDGGCQGETAVYDVGDSIDPYWGKQGASGMMTFGMIESPETARFDGGSARLDVYFDIIGFDYTPPDSGDCGRHESEPAYYRSSMSSYRGFLVDTWRSDVIDLGLTWNATFFDSDTDEAVQTTEVRDVALDSRPYYRTSQALDDGYYRVEYDFASSTTDFSYQSSACDIGIDTADPEIVEVAAADGGPHYNGDLIRIEVTVADAGFPDGRNELSVCVNVYCAGEYAVVLDDTSTATFEFPVSSSTFTSPPFYVFDKAGNRAVSGTMTAQATYDHHDYDQDGYQDMVTVRRSDGHLVFHAGNGDGTFDAAVSKGSGWEMMDIVMAGDLTGDGLPDLLARHGRTGYLYTYPGNGAGGFSSSGRVYVGSGWNGMASFTSGGDFNRDGKLDALAIGKSDGKLYFYPGGGDGTFGSATAVAEGWESVDTLTTLGDVNRDGDYDVLTRETWDGYYTVWFGDGSGAFDHHEYIEPSLIDGDGSTRFDQVAGVGDTTGDGYVDIAAVDSRTGELVLRSFDETARNLHDSQVVGPAWGGVRLPTVHSDRTYDYNSDGAADIVSTRTSSGELNLYRGDGAGGFSSPLVVGDGWDRMNLVESAGDFDGDGHADLIARDAPTGTLYLYPGTAYCCFGARVEIGIGWNGMSTILAGHDYDGDGKPDIIARESSSGNLWLYPGTGSGKVGSRQLLGTGWNPMREITAVGDLDHDGHADLIAIQNTSGCLYLYGGRGDGTFESRVEISCGWGNYGPLAAAGDIDGDGHNDWLARRNTDGTLYAYLADGRGDYDFSRRLNLGTGWNGMNFIA